MNNAHVSIVETTRIYIHDKLMKAFEKGDDYVDIMSGDIHKELNFNSRMPTVCSAMYKLKTLKDEILRTTPSGYSSTIKIRYYRRDRE